MLVWMSEESREGVVVLMLYFPELLVMEVTVVLRRVSACEELSIPAKIRQLPPSICMAPSMAMQTIVSRPWMILRF